MADPSDARIRRARRRRGLLTGEAVALDVRPASAVLRAGGAAIDVLSDGSSSWLARSWRSPGSPRTRRLAVRGHLAGSSDASWCCRPRSRPRARGRSLGKLALGLRVVRDDGGADRIPARLHPRAPGRLEICLTFGGLAVLVGFLNPAPSASATCSPARTRRSSGCPATCRRRSACRRRSPRGRHRRRGAPARPASPVASRRSSGTRRTSRPRAGRVAERARRRGRAVRLPGPAGRRPSCSSPRVAALRRERDLTALALEDARMAALEPVLDAPPVGFPDR